MTSDDAIENVIGRFGKYQTWILVLISIGRLPTEFQLTNVVFLLPNTDFICLDEGIQNATNHCPCTQPEYDRSTIVESLISEWDLICDKKYLASLTQSMLQVGILTGSLFYGFISDRYGRRIAIVLALFCEALFTMISAFATGYWMFLIFRILIGTALGGTMLCCYVFLIELSGKSFRPYLIGLHELSYVTGYFILPIIAYFLREWRDLQLALSVPWLLVIVIYWLIPESPRWLITVGKTKEAVYVLTHIAKKNNRPIQDIEAIVDQVRCDTIKDHQKQTGSYQDLFKTPKVRFYTFITSLIWMFCSLIFFGVNQYIGQLQGNVYLNVMISAASLLPALVLIVTGTLYLKRRTTIFATFSIAGASLLIFIFVYEQSLILAFAIIGQIGAYSSFILVYLFTSEVFPTIVRNSAMGFASTFGRVGGFVAPFIVNIGIEWVSILIFSSLAFVSASLCYLLPETKNITLLNTIEQTEKPNDQIEQR
ncbi:unnamed protein product [Diatraea saccharalis]|uniref:Major facilitator superfamily (MFS) profile domain-containing protein n=1 Tax=Diatraea saccharalis TaxID=40085 RepID=A0A9N9R1W4_9NEOP|nr:unnamed protein product [Diatraea saccharalis]